MSRSELEALMAEINANRPTGALAIPYCVLAALQTTHEIGLPVSDVVFRVMLNYILRNEIFPNVKVYNIDAWLEDDRVKGSCYFVYQNHTHVIFLSSNQYYALTEIMRIPLDASNRDDLIETPLSVIGTGTPTEEELADPLVKAYYITPNSGSTTVAEHTSRFSGATWFEEIQKKVIILAGLGGIGSYVCFLLARVQPKSLFLYDDDLVEAVNMSGQLYGMADIDEYKVDAISSMVERYANYNSVCAIRERFTSRCEATDIMICGFDNMSARHTFFDSWLAHVNNKPNEERAHCLFIDGRLSAEYFQVYCITGDDVASQQKYASNCLFSDEDADETVCSYKQTTYMANMIGSVMVNLFTNFVANEVAGAPIRELPFFTEYDGNSMVFKIE